MTRSTPNIAATSCSELDELDDEALIESLANGRNAALAVLFSRHRTMVLRMAMKVLGDVGEAEDLTQSVFLEVLRHAGQFDAARGSGKSWILAIAYTRSINQREWLLRRRFYHWEPFDDRFHSPSSRQEPIANAEHYDLFRRLHRGLAALSECQRRIIHRVCFEGWTLREIATETGESFANVRHRYYRGLKKMRALVSAAEGVTEA